ncbi:MAG: hypothetical protein OSB28_03510, partial [Flavobacteriales bacterium]|nr:hypothetical protein [Flavobacteriales bacterium]
MIFHKLSNSIFFRFALVFTTLALFFTGCADISEEEIVEHQTINTESNPSVPGFDWSNDPLKVGINDNLLNSKMGRDTLNG